MDRSSMRVVQTNDNEKRLAFKNSLASKIDSLEKVQEAPFQEPPFVSVGQRVAYPSLGTGTVVSVEEDRLVIQFATGPIPMDIPQAKRYLSIVSSETKIDEWNEAFIGEKFERPVLDHGDLAFRPIAEQPVKIVEEKPVEFVPVREPKPEPNEAFIGEVIERPVFHRPDVAYRPVVEQPVQEWSEPKPVEFVPVKEAKRDSFEGATFGDEIVSKTPIVGETVSRPVTIQPKKDSVAIPELPVGAYVWHPDLGNCQVHSLNEKANLVTLRVVNQDLEVELVLSHAKSKLTLIDKAPEHVPMKPLKREQVRIDAKPAPRDVSVVLPPSFSTWSFASKYHFLNFNQHLTPEEANDVFAVLDGKSPLVHEVTIHWAEQDVLPAPKEFVLDNDVIVPEHISVGARVWYPELGAATVEFVNEKEIGFILDDGRRITSLSRLIEPKLVPLGTQTVESAKKVGFKVVEPKPEPVKAEPVILSPREIKPDNYYHSPVEKPIKVAEPFGVNRQVEEVEVVTKVIKAVKLEVTLPMAFKTWTQSDQYLFLSRTKKLSPNEANDVLAIYLGDKPQGNIQYEITWSE